jgi:hypothetical protein
MNIHPHTWRAPVLLMGLMAALAIDTSASDPTFTSTWKAPEASTIRFTGKKVAALVITSDQNLQVSGEENLARELAARGIQSVATYRMVPREELVSAERARPWFERAGVEGVVTLRPVSAKTQTSYTPTVWATSSYSSLWGYYGYGWTSIAGVTREDTTLVVETLIHSVPLDKLLWAGVSKTTNPKQVPAFVKALVAETVKEMKKQGLVK